MKIIRKSKNIKLKHSALRFDIEQHTLYGCTLELDKEKMTIYCFEYNSIYFYQKNVEFIHDITLLKIISL